MNAIDGIVCVGYKLQLSFVRFDVKTHNVSYMILFWNFSYNADTNSVDYSSLLVKSEGLRYIIEILHAVI
ncbi:hypothetical protein NEF87_000836 [Candidatus Lokiarchaeum ossiferum]|uniref:Uncharacterized protein n=1 Tax=Candidatus Lokiarchaeum ossiferum TaxID=2951803 RepID=A0ABY6HPT3_9ARCH|nr:hypothetical protein NEF87_000836 [Candidatus Lokiarchaeum sp. B-35]